MEMPRSKEKHEDSNLQYAAPASRLTFEVRREAGHFSTPTDRGKEQGELSIYGIEAGQDDIKRINA